MTGLRVFGAGLALAAAVMLVAEMFMVLILRRLELLLLAAPLTVVFVLTAGAAVGWFTARITRGMNQRKASLVFFVTGFVAGALWGFPIFTVLVNSSLRAAQAAGTAPEEPVNVVGLALAGSAYLASTAGLGALCARYLGPFVAVRPRLVAMSVGAVAVVTVISLVLLFGVRFS